MDDDFWSPVLAQVQRGRRGGACLRAWRLKAKRFAVFFRLLSPMFPFVFALPKTTAATLGQHLGESKATALCAVVCKGDQCNRLTITTKNCCRRVTSPAYTSTASHGAQVSSY